MSQISKKPGRWMSSASARREPKRRLVRRKRRGKLHSRSNAVSRRRVVKQRKSGVGRKKRGVKQRKSGVGRKRRGVRPNSKIRGVGLRRSAGSPRRNGVGWKRKRRTPLQLAKMNLTRMPSALGRLRSSSKARMMTNQSSKMIRTTSILRTNHSERLSGSRNLNRVLARSENRGFDLTGSAAGLKGNRPPQSSLCAVG